MTSFSHGTTRRQFLSTCAAASAGSLVGSPTRAAAPAVNVCTLGFGTYGMKTLTTEAAIRLIAELGFDSVEITVWPDWDAAPARMPTRRRREIRRLIADKGLTLSALMEHVAPTADESMARSHRERLNRVAELAADLAEGRPAMIQTVLGGSNWEASRQLFLKRLSEWGEIMQAHKVTLAIKPHRGGAMSQPAEAVWLHQQLGRPDWLRMVYDYSHYAFRDLPVARTIEQALPITAHVAVKDAVQDGKRVVFQLPGSSGTFDYKPVLQQLYRGGYRGDFCCEVSSMVWRQPDYDPVQAATACYRQMSAEFDRAGVPRPKR